VIFECTRFAYKTVVHEQTDNFINAEKVAM